MIHAFRLVADDDLYAVFYFCSPACRDRHRLVRATVARPFEADPGRVPPGTACATCRVPLTTDLGDPPCSTT